MYFYLIASFLTLYAVYFPRWRHLEYFKTSKFIGLWNKANGDIHYTKIGGLIFVIFHIAKWGKSLTFIFDLDLHYAGHFESLNLIFFWLGPPFNVQRFLSYSIKFLLQCSKIEKSRQDSYISLGRVVEALSKLRLESVSEIMEAICLGFTIPFCKEVTTQFHFAFICITWSLLRLV